MTDPFARPTAEDAARWLKRIETMPRHYRCRECDRLHLVGTDHG